MSENMQQILYFIENGRKFLSNEFYNQFLKILIYQCEYILKETEKMIINAGIYNPINIRSGLGSNTTLKEKVLFAYNATSQEELTNHFTNERERLSKIIDTYTQNAFTIMNKIYSIMPNYSSETFLKWRAIISDVDNYMDTTIPNSLHDLERYILVDVMNANSYSDLTKKSKIYGKKMFFRNVVNTINKIIVSEFINTQRVRFFEMYDEIKEFFNTNIGGKFPFINLQKMKSQNFEEVGIEEMKTFLKILHKNRECFEIIVNDKNLDINPEIRLFLEQIGAIYEIFKIDDDGIIYVNGFIDFNTNENKGINVENISGSKLTILNSYEKDSSVRISDSKKLFKWTMKNDIELSFFISHASKYRFANISNQICKVTDHNTTFILEHSNHWSLFKLILENIYGSNGKIKIVMPLLSKHHDKKNHRRSRKQINNSTSENAVFILSIKFQKENGQIIPISFPKSAPDYMKDYMDELENE
jgi:hypothetical protein